MPDAQLVRHAGATLVTSDDDGALLRPDRNEQTVLQCAAFADETNGTLRDTESVALRQIRQAEIARHRPQAIVAGLRILGDHPDAAEADDVIMCLAGRHVRRRGQRFQGERPPGFGQRVDQAETDIDRLDAFPFYVGVAVHAKCCFVELSPKLQV